MPEPNYTGDNPFGGFYVFMGLAALFFLALVLKSCW